MSMITKTANNVTVIIDKSKRLESIIIKKEGNVIASGYDLLYSIKDMPKGAVSALRGSGNECQALGQSTTTLIEQALEEYYQQDEIRLPGEREALKMEISMAYDKSTYLREQDYNNDIGFHLSPDVDKEIDIAQKALKDFDIANPKLAAKIKKENEIETVRQIQSALNA